MQHVPYAPSPYQQDRPPAKRPSRTFLVCLIIALGIGAIQFHTFFVYQTYQQGLCTIQNGSIERQRTKNSVHYMPYLQYMVHTKNGQTAYAEGYDGPSQEQYSTYTAAQQILASYTVGANYPCWYNPVDPAHALLVFRGFGILSLILSYLITAIIALFCLHLLLRVFTTGIYLPIRLMTWGVSTQGQVTEHITQVTEHITRHRKGRTSISSRIVFQSQNVPYLMHSIQVHGTYPIGSQQPVCYDPDNPSNAKHGNPPAGCGPMIVTLLCIGIAIIGLLSLWNIWSSV